MKKLIKLSSFLLLLVLAACLEPPLKNASARGDARLPAQQSMSAPISTPQVAPEQEFGQTANSAVIPAGAIKVALLAPLSGKAQKIGKAIADAAQMGIYTEGSSNVHVVQFDTKGTAEGAAEAVYRAVEELAPDAIVGPLFSDEVSRVAPIARSNNIPVFAFSNDKKVGGNGVYLMGLMPDQQVERLAMYAAANGVANFGATVPQNVLGTEVEKMLKASVSANRKKLLFTEQYSVINLPDYSLIAGSISGKLAKDGGLSGLSNSTHAVVMPEIGESLQKLLTSLGERNINGDNVRFMGTASWDNPETLAMPLLNNAWYTAVPFKDMNNFMLNFQENFGYRPPQLASLSYDAILLIAELGKDQLYEQYILRNDGFFGSNGAYRFLPTGVSERAYDIMQISNGSVSVVDPAKKFF